MIDIGAMMPKVVEMREQIKECIEEFEKEKTEVAAARLIICLYNNKETIYWDDDLKRLKCAAEVHDEKWAPLMEEITKVLGIKNRDEYIKIKNKYNLTQY
jgi:hypothetical protein